MFSNDDGGGQGRVLAIVSGLIALAIALATAVAMQWGGAVGSPPALKTVVMPQAAPDTADIKVDYGVVRFYFAPGKAVLPAGADDVLADLVRGAQAGRKLVISGFHDTSGGAAQNAVLATQRAFAVRDALRRAGLPASVIEIRTPEKVEGSADAQARRVEVTLQ